MNVLYFLLLLAGALLFLVHGLGLRYRNRDLVAFGLLLWILVPLIQVARLL